MVSTKKIKIKEKKKAIKKLLKERVQNKYCWVCGSKEGTKHHTDPLDKTGLKIVTLCREHHDDIEKIKLAILLMKRKNKEMTPRQFQQMIEVINKWNSIGLI